MNYEKLEKLIDYLRNKDDIDIETLNEIEMIFNISTNVIYHIFNEINKIIIKNNNNITTEAILIMLELEMYDVISDIEYYQRQIERLHLDDELLGEAIKNQENTYIKLENYQMFFGYKEDTKLFKLK